MATAPNARPGRKAYGRCRARPVLGTARSKAVIRFEIESDDRVIAVTAAVDDRSPAEIEAWMTRIEGAPILSVRGFFRPRYGKAALVGEKAWRIHATEIRIPEPDNGRPGIRAARAFAQDREGQERGADPPTREITITDLTPPPLRPHNGNYALAFNAKVKGQPLTILHPVVPSCSREDLTVLSDALVRAETVTALGYFRPEVIRSDQVAFWGFVARSLQPVAANHLSRDSAKDAQNHATGQPSQ